MAGVSRAEILAGSVDGTLRRFDVRVGLEVADDLGAAVTSVSVRALPPILPPTLPPPSPLPPPVPLPPPPHPPQLSPSSNTEQPPFDTVFPPTPTS